VVNLLALLWLISLLGPAMVQSSGVTVELPPSRFQLERYRNHLVVTIGVADDGPAVYLGRDRVDLKSLSARLDAIGGADGASRTLVLLQSDSGASVGVEREVAELILEKGFRLAVAGANRVSGASPIHPSTR
jgi:biopolymer transport protein ExbD